MKDNFSNENSPATVSEKLDQIVNFSKRQIQPKRKTHAK